jgi:DNA-directed RNA polymerase specialized sigma subunit
MIVPDGYTEEQVMTIVETVVKRIAPGFTFGYYDRDDMIQEGYVELIKNALPKYNGSHPLENFLSSHLKKRMLTLIRDKFHRNDPPCKQCPLYNKAGKDCTEYKNMLDCD